MFSKQSPEFLETNERNERRIQLWKGAVDIVKTMADLHQNNPDFIDCGWRGDHRDVAAVADHLSSMNPDTLQQQVQEAALWINAEQRRDANGLKVLGRPVVHELLHHLRMKFPNG